MPGGEKYAEVKGILRDLKLHTVCEEARCPNVAECWGGGTATFMLMGDVCTRGCRFCAVKTSKRGVPLDPEEPVNVARAIASLGLHYVVLTSVDRDDLPDGGADHFARTVESLHGFCPDVKVEVLIPDFQGDEAALSRLVASRPDVIAQNQETVRRLTHPVRDPRADYDVTLGVLARVKELDPTRYTKSSIMLGLGETEDELVEAMRDLREVGVDVLTLGQYLQPTPRHLPVVRFVPPPEFDHLAEVGRGLGFAYVASGPLVRSSYRAGEFFIRNVLLAGKHPPESRD